MLNMAMNSLVMLTSIQTSTIWIIVAGSLIVSTPQDVALIDARRGVRMFSKVNVPV